LCGSADDTSAADGVMWVVVVLVMVVINTYKYYQTRSSLCIYNPTWYVFMNALYKQEVENVK